MNDIDKILDEILDELEKYDGTVESGIKIIESNQIRIDKLRKVFIVEDMVLEAYQPKMEMIINKQSELFQSLEIEKAELLKMLQQIGKKNKVVSSYISKNRQPIFVDKDM